MTNGRTVGIGLVLVALLSVPVTATAVATIRSADIVDGQVKTQDLAKSAVTSKKVAHNALKGSDIKESSLGRVPEAASLHGLTVKKVFLDKHESGSGNLLSMAGLRVRYSCNNPGELFVYAKAEASSEGTFSYYTYSGGLTDFAQAGQEVEIASAAIGNRAVGHLQYWDPAGHVVTFDWTIVSFDSCLFVGTAVGG